VSACDPIKFSDISPQKFADLSAKASSEAGVAIIGNDGQADSAKYGISVSWSYDPIAQELTLQVVKKPLLVPCSYVNQKLKEVLGG
jgi:hypothetical protein